MLLSGRSKVAVLPVDARSASGPLILVKQGLIGSDLIRTSFRWDECIQFVLPSDVSTFLGNGDCKTELEIRKW